MRGLHQMQAVIFKVHKLLSYIQLHVPLVPILGLDQFMQLSSAASYYVGSQTDANDVNGAKWMWHVTHVWGACVPEGCD